VDFALSDEQSDFVDAIRDFCDRECGTQDQRERLTDGYRDHHNFDVYKQMAELGWLGVTIPEEYGGSGGSMLDACLFMEETSRGLAPIGGYATTLIVAGATQLLVATTVIEVGVDVPNASLMVIENAERMGLAQLHQLRGRVGRGVHESNCVLLYRAPLSQMARARLGTIRDTSDGFRIANRDLELRGPGELLGRRQTGLAQLRIADLSRDADLLGEVRAAAALMIESTPQCVAALRLRWIGEREQYGRVG